MSGFRFEPGRNASISVRRSGCGNGLFWPVILLAAGLLAAACGARGSEYPTNSRNPCVILIVADDLGYGDLGCYGQQKIKTPHLDRLAAEGMRFTSYYAGNSLSAPARAALLTGRDTGHSADRGVGVFPLGRGVQLLPEILKQAGYTTAAAGKWGLGSVVPAGQRGFDDWAGYLNDSEAQDYFPYILSRVHHGTNETTTIRENANGGRGRYANDIFSQAAMNFMRSYPPKYYNNFRSYFIYLAPTLPYASPETGGASGAGAVVPSDAPYQGNTAWLPAERTRAAMITRLDAYVDELTNQLQTLKNDPNTMIIFTSTTGPQHDAEIDPSFFRSTGPFRGFKHELYEGAIRVPLIVRWPVQIKPGSVSDLPCAAWDLLPTIAEAAHVNAPGVDGLSLLPTLTGRAQTNRHEYLYWELHDHGFKQAVRVGDWKAIRTSVDGPLELYDLKDDPGENKNVADKHPEVIAQVTGILKTARTEDTNWPITRERAAGGD